MKTITELDKLRHTCSHVMAQAVKELWPETKVAIGPAIENGFYYDFDRPEPFTPEDLKKIEKAMRKIIQSKAKITQKFVSKEEAIKLFEGMGENYKVELINEIPDEKVSLFYTDDKWFDLCKGPHVSDAGQIKAFKLLSVAGSYWRGDEHKARLQRIYGTCFTSEKELKEHLRFLEEAKKRDHRKLGTELELFSIHHETVGGGLIIYHPNGAMIRKIIEDYAREENLKRGYEFIITPHILKGKLWEQSGHADYYKDFMYYFNVDEEEYVVKPMNCPGHILVYKSKLRSYRELPIRFFELGTVYRQEKAGVLHGLLRVRGFTQDDAHIFCQQDQIKDEIKSVMDFVFDTMRDFGFREMDIEVSTRPEKFIGKVENWDTATKALKDSLEEKKIKYAVCEGEGAFYGPKIDVKLKDAIGRSWQCSTIQCDFALPERFDMKYTNDKGELVRPIMIHRAIFGSLERFLGTLIEHYAGTFPLWLSPVQVLIIPIHKDHEDFAVSVKEDLQKEGIRVIIDARSETLNKRIREGTLKKIPYLLIIGDKEVEKDTVSIRTRGVEDKGAVKTKEFIKQIKKEIEEKI